MSRYFFERLELGYKGVKGEKTQRHYENNNVQCSLKFCNKTKTKYKGIGSHLCEEHQHILREYGGPGRYDRPWTMNKKACCDYCGKDPWQHPKVKQIDDNLIRDRVAWGMLIVDHIVPQKYEGGDAPENCQTLCLDCNQIKTTLACDSMPRALYKDKSEYQLIKQRLKPWLDKLFG